MNPVNWFEIPVNNYDTAKKFYEAVFNTQFQELDMEGSKMAMFQSEQGAAGSTGALVKQEGYTPSQEGSVVYFSVEDIEGTLARIDANGGSTVLPKMSIGEYGFIAQFIDCEGNRVALHSEN